MASIDIAPVKAHSRDRGAFGVLGLQTKGLVREMSGSRSGRWLVAGAAVVLLAGVGGVLQLSAVGSDGSTSFVPITPCRLMDTRAGGQVGPRGTPIGAGETYSPLVWGTNGNCTIPATATAVSMNVTFVGPTAGGFVTVFPPDQALPNTSNLNFSAGQAPAPNAVTSPLSSDGRIGFFNFAGTVNLIADIVGYYEEPESPAPGSEGLVAGRCAALLRWDRAECKNAAYATGDGPLGVAFDGTYIWVANENTDNVSRINPATGAKTDFAAGDGPYGLAFDGTSIWVANGNADTVSKINPTTGAKTDFATGDGPRGVAFDGTSIWITNANANTVSKMNPATGTKTDFATGTEPTGVAFDGTSIWVANFATDNVSKINPATGTKTDFAAGDGPYGVAFDGNSIWITNFLADTVTRKNPATGTTTSTFGTGDGPRGVAFDGTSIWTANTLASTVSKMNPLDGTIDDVFTTGTGPFFLAFDGSYIWITNQGVDTVSKMVP